MMQWKCAFQLLLLLLLLPLMVSAVHSIDEDDDATKATATGVDAGDGLGTGTGTGTGTGAGAGSGAGAGAGAETAGPASCSQSADKTGPQMAANIATKAAQVATAANDAQSNAAECAAKEVRIQMAEKALQASRSVQAVLEGKRALLDKIQQELNAAMDLVAKLTASLQQSEVYAQKSECAAKTVEAHFGRMAEIVQVVGASLNDVEALNELAQSDYNEKQQMLIAAKERCERIQKQVACVREEYQQVKMAAYQAACAAVEAKQKAANAAEHGGIACSSNRNTLRRRRRRGRQRQRQRKRHIQQQKQEQEQQQQQQKRGS